MRCRQRLRREFRANKLAVDSIVRTLGANVNVIRQLKILIRGQETDTLAGHLDCPAYFLFRRHPRRPAPAHHPFLMRQSRRAL